ncbi:hypothetical protein TRICI_000733 [Trichomonascus ciferrii]|uniref:D-lactate dehydratase n=1 Tax=Trichomonascus ciferrii TaxID=44093 RepID=A0A642VB35_9ASCO|nr:hypothetical protein TRICI_000733 [Trichomonascus ciferrii]
MSSTKLPKKVLLAVTGVEEELGPMGKVGLFYCEATHPFEAFTKAGYEIDFVSESGTYHIDSHSLEKPFFGEAEEKIYNDPEHKFNRKLKAIKKASEVNAEDYGVFFAAGGHGALFDFYDAPNLQKIISSIYNRGGVIAAVCHGPCILFGARDEQGASIVKGKNVTGFTQDGEKQMGVWEAMADKGLPSIEKKAILTGANYIPPPSDWEDFVQVDGRIVTGVNPSSATSTAQSAVKVFDGLQQLNM